MDTIWSQKSIWSFTAVDFLDFDFFPIKGETPECSPNSNTYMPACFAIIGSIVSTTQKFVNDVRAQAIGHFIFELEKLGNTCRWFKNNSNFTKGKVFTDTIS